MIQPDRNVYQISDPEQIGPPAAIVRGHDGSYLFLPVRKALRRVVPVLNFDGTVQP